MRECDLDRKDGVNCKSLLVSCNIFKFKLTNKNISRAWGKIEKKEKSGGF